MPMLSVPMHGAAAGKVQRLLSLAQIARLFGMNRATLYSRFRRGNFPAPDVDDGHRLWSLDSALKYAKENPEIVVDRAELEVLQYATGKATGHNRRGGVPVNEQGRKTIERIVANRPKRRPYQTIYVSKATAAALLGYKNQSRIDQLIEDGTLQPDMEEVFAGTEAFSVGAFRGSVADSELLTKRFFDTNGCTMTEMIAALREGFGSR